jgi:hypothetical protein
MKKALFLMGLLSLTISFHAVGSDGVQKYENPALGVSFNYPGTLTVDKSRSQENPLSVVFSYGQPPFATSILFKEVAHSTSLDEFVENERKIQQEEGYQVQVEERSYVIQDKISAVEFVRTSEMGKIYYTVFPSQTSGGLLAFWHMTSKAADPDEYTVEAYKIMIESLVLTR